MHDPRVGRFFAVDPLAGRYPYNSPYAFSQNRVIDGVELEGLEMETAGKIMEDIWREAFGPIAHETKATAVEIKRKLINSVKDAYPPNKTAQHLIEHFAYGNGGNYILNEKEMKEVFPARDWENQKLDVSIPDEKFKELGHLLFGGARPHSEKNIEAYAATSGTLGRTYLVIEGEITEELLGGVKTLVFRGVVIFYDEWDFNPSNGADKRGGIAEVLTTMGRIFLPGTSFKIFGEIEVIQYEGEPMKFVNGEDATGETSGNSEQVQDDNATDSGAVNEIQG